MPRQRTIPGAIEAFLTASTRSEPLSLASGVRAVRSALPTCELADSELAELIATHAVARGFPVLIFNIAAHAAPKELESC